MKTFIKKYILVVCGMVLTAFCGPVIVSAATKVPETGGNPALYNGVSGTRVSARGTTGRFGSIQQLGLEIIRFIEVVLVPLIMSLALIAFLWGVLQYIRKGGDPGEREQGRQFMLWGIIALAVMASVWGLVRIITNTIGAPMGIPSLDPIE